jgi:predicted nucleotidyltransferase
MDRSVLLAHIRKTHFAPGDRERANADARAIADYLRAEFGARTWGIGSAFDRTRRFTRSSDIDLIAEGIPDRRFFEASARAARMTEFRLDLIPLESANNLIRSRVREEGVEL